jgi:hypothetical protein
MSQLTTPLRVNSHGHAVIVALHAAGIPATIADSHFQSVYPGLEFGAFRPRILVPPACETEARAIIAQARAVPDEPIYPCTSCGGETTIRARSYLSLLKLALAGRFSLLLDNPRYCSDCDSYAEAPKPEPFTAEELGYPPIR